MRSSRPISEISPDNPSRVVNKTVLDDISRIQRVVCVILVLFYIFTAADFNSEFPESLRSLLRLIGYGIVFLLVLIKPKRHFRFLVSNKLLLALIVFAIASVTWSLFPSATILSLRSLIKSYLFAVCFVSMYSVREQIRLIQLPLVAGGIASAFVALLMPEIGTRSDISEVFWQGIYGHKQYLGGFMLICSSTFIPFIFKSKSKTGFYLNSLGLLFCLSISYFSGSKTSIIGILILVLSLPYYILLSYSYNLGQKIRSLFFIIFGFGALVFIALILSNYETIMVDILRKGTDINGRLPLWVLCIVEGMKRPILGYGYYGFWSSDAGISIAYRTSWMSPALYNPLYWNPGETFPWHAHNGLLEVFLNLGIVGLTLLLLSVGHTAAKILSKLKVNQLSTSYYSPEVHWMFLLLLLIFMLNVTEANFLKANDILWVSYMIATINLSAGRV
jgi:O-antigen ligase